MSELINNSREKKKLLKHMILQLHEGEAPGLVRKRLIEVLRSVPYDMVVEVEQELISEGLPAEEVLKLCDIHTDVLDGHIDVSEAKDIPAGHPVDVFKMENVALKEKCREIKQALMMLNSVSMEDNMQLMFSQLKTLFNDLSDVEKHYQRKENLLFPYLEKNEITGPPKVMWGKHDETRELLRASHEILDTRDKLDAEDVTALIDMVFLPALKAVEDMIMKEEEILFPMCMDLLSEADWFEIHKQTLEIGFCLYDPETDWNPGTFIETGETDFPEGTIRLPSGNFVLEELLAIFSTLPLDITFVNKNDKVKFFSQGKHRIFQRSRAILGRDVRMCHPPGSVHVVEQILSDFKNHKRDKASFWIQMKGRFILIEYYALWSNDGNYMGTLEVSQDLTDARKLEGEQRLLSY